MPPSLFSPKQVAEALRVSESSVKRWCDSGVISMLRTAGGHRRITLDELMRFVSETDRPLLNPMAIGLTQPPKRSSGDSLAGSEDVQDQFCHYLAAGDEARCRQIVEKLLAQTQSVTQVIEHLLSDAMHRFGDSWEKDELEVFQERRGCEICQRLIFHLRTKLPPPNGPIAIGASPEGDPYHLPTTLVELALREAGWNAESLGPNIPFPSLRKAIDQYQPRLVWLSVSTVDDQAAFVAQFNELARQMPDDCALLVGGRALDDTLRPKLRYTAHCDNLLQLIALADVMRRRTNTIKMSQN
jgi:excisionase family DNA binding protein